MTKLTLVREVEVGRQPELSSSVKDLAELADRLYRAQVAVDRAKRQLALIVVLMFVTFFAIVVAVVGGFP